ncbi:hypothetical protein RUND412_009328 [Rhizina undulata]
MIPISYLSEKTKLGIALVLLKSKPPDLSLSEYISLLRTHTTPGTRPTDNDSYIEATEFWRERAESEASKAFNLQAKVAELEELNRNLLKKGTENAKEADDSKKGNEKEGPVAKKRKRNGNGAGMPVKNGLNKKGQTKQQVIAAAGDEGDLEAIFAPLVSPKYNLLSSLRLLHYAPTIALLSMAIKKTCKGLLEVVHYSAHEDQVRSRTFIRNLQAPSKQSREWILQEKEIQDLCQAIEKTCTKLFSALSALNKSEGQGDGSAPFTADAIVDIIDLFKGMLFSIHENTQALLLVYLKPAHKVTKDLRVGTMNVLIRTLIKLDLNVKHEGNILEGIIYCLLEILGKLLQPQVTDEAEHVLNDQKAMEKLALEESSWYLLRILEALSSEYYRCTMSVTKEPNDLSESRDLGKRGRERLKEALLKGVFGGTGSGPAENNALNSGRTAVFVESAITRELWDLLGMEIFTDDDS